MRWVETTHDRLYFGFAHSEEKVVTVKIISDDA